MRLAKRLLILVLGAFSLPVAAGYTLFYEASIDPVNGYAYAALRDASRVNGYLNADKYLQCAIFDAAGNIECSGVDGANNSFICNTNAQSNPAFAKHVLAINSASFVAIYWVPPVAPATRGGCTDIRVIHGSQFLPSDPNAYQFNGQPVTLYPGEVHANVGRARYSDDPLEFVACESFASGSVSCTARDSAGTMVSCYTSAAANPVFAERVQAMDHASWVHIYFNPSTGVCDRISMYKGSNQLPIHLFNRWQQ